jgi:general secretion pathway protein A
MYIKHFRLSEPPFSLTPDPHYFFMSARHREGLAHLIYGIQQPGGFVLLTGEIGSGKTTLCRCLIKQLPRETDIALILNPRMTAIELLAAVCDELRIPYPPKTDSVKVLIDALNQRLLENHAQRKQTALVIDEAQNLSEDVLEQIRLLTNLETSTEKLLQIILIGQPELLSVLKRKELRQLEQRITARYHLLPMSRNETISYIRHRLLIAGRSDSVFTPFAMRRVYRLSAGVPRIINIVCDRALLGAYASDKRDVTASIVTRAYRETQGVGKHGVRYALIAAVAMVAALACGLVFFFKPTRLPGFKPKAISTNAKKNDAPAARSTKITDPKENEKAAPASAVLQALDPKKTEIHAASNSEVRVSSDSLSAAHLADILLSPEMNGATSASFIAIYLTWGVKVALNPSDLGCKVGQEQGFACLFQSGDWSRLRRFDIPAMLEMKLPNGRRKYVALIGLRDATAKLVIGNREYVFPLSEIDALWTGSVILLWKPPFNPHPLSLGARGKDVLWIAQALDSAEGKAPGSSKSDEFDENLRQRVLAFQRSRALMEDGAVGNETLVRLALALEGSNAPSLSNRLR